MSARDTEWQFDLMELKRDEVAVYQSRRDYEAETGRQASPYNPALPNKYWAWSYTAARRVTYLIAQVVPGLAAAGRILVEELTIPIAYAQSVNIPATGSGGSFIGELNPDTEPLPIKELRPEEELVLTFGGVIVVRNKTRNPHAQVERGLHDKLDLIITELKELRRIVEKR